MIFLLAIGINIHRNVCVLSPNYSSINELFIIYNGYKKEEIIYNDFNYETIVNTFINVNYETKVNLFIFEFPKVDYSNCILYIRNLIIVLLIIVKYQSFQGTCIIKIHDIFYKPIIDIIYILTSLYDKTNIIKPNTSNITSGERYIVCKNFIFDQQINTHIESNLEKLYELYKETNIHIHSLICNSIPYYFMNKIEESNITIGEQQLESYNQLINLCNHKNIIDKLEILKRNNIHKCVQWCDKNEIPHNKFMDKINMFFNSTKKTIIV